MLRGEHGCQEKQNNKQILQKALTGSRNTPPTLKSYREDNYN